MKLTTGHKFLVGTAVGIASAVGFLAIVRPRHLHWGATDLEAREQLPGDELIPDARSVATHAITIDAVPDDVWPWIAQIGQDKGGFYSYTWLENLVGCQMRNADRVHPEWQVHSAGEPVKFHPMALTVPIALIDEGRHVVLGSEFDAPNASTWTFVLRDLGNGRTRLIVRLRAKTHGGMTRLGELFLLEPAHFVMEKKMLLTIKRLAESRGRRNRVA